jgi:hypothetical protein
VASSEDACPRCAAEEAARAQLAELGYKVIDRSKFYALPLDGLVHVYRAGQKTYSFSQLHPAPSIVELAGIMLALHEGPTGGLEGLKTPGDVTTFLDREAERYGYTLEGYIAPFDAHRPTDPQEVDRRRKLAGSFLDAVKRGARQRDIVQVTWFSKQRVSELVRSARNSS